MLKKIHELFSDIIFCLKLSFATSKFYTLIRIGIQAIKALLPIIGVYVLKDILNSLINTNKESALSIFSLLVFLYLVVQILSQWTSKLDEYIQQIHEGMLENHITKNLIIKTARIDISFFDSPDYYDRIQLLRSNIYAINQIVWNVVELCSSIISFITAAAIMFQYNAILTFIIIVSYIPISIFDQKYITKLYNWQTKNIGEERKMGYISNILTQKIHSKSIRIFGIADYLLDIYKGLWQAWFVGRKKLLKKWSIISLLLSVIPQLLTVLILLSVGVSIINGTNSIGDFSLYSGILGQLIASVFLISFMIARISENKIRINDFKELNSWVNQVEGTGEVDLALINEIEFKNVSFTYPGNKIPALKNINFNFSAKERLAFVGANGAGKTTIIKLLLRFYDVSEGEILINGINIKRYKPESIRKQYSVMFQDYINYAFTLRENIRISDITKPKTDENILDACRKSGADQVIQKTKKGLDCFVYREFDEEGIELSGGENQKIALGRTFFKDGECIILDEPSSSLDPESEYIFFKKMIELCDGKGVILISHRLSNVILADRILVIEGGELIEQGTHAELISRNGRYATLFNFQAERYNIS